MGAWSTDTFWCIPPAVLSGVVTAVVFIAVCALAVMSRLLYQQRQAQRSTSSSIKEEHRQSVYTDYRTELQLHNPIRDNMKEYYIWHSAPSPALSCRRTFLLQTGLVGGKRIRRFSISYNKTSLYKNKRVAESLQLLVYLMLVKLSQSSCCGFCRCKMCKAKIGPSAGGGRHAPRGERELQSVNAHNFKCFVWNPQMLNIFHISVGLNCTGKSGNVGQACKICARSLLSLFFSSGGECVRRRNGDDTAYTVWVPNLHTTFYFNILEVFLVICTKRQFSFAYRG